MLKLIIETLRNNQKNLRDSYEELLKLNKLEEAENIRRASMEVSQALIRLNTSKNTI